MRILIIFWLILLQSCKTTFQKDLTINAKIIKDEKLLVLTIHNNTDKDFYVEFPSLDRFFYEGDFKRSNPEGIFLSVPIEAITDKYDKLYDKKMNCPCFSKEIKENNSQLRFIDKKQRKEYYFRITDYRKGEKILLIDDDFETIINYTSNKYKKNLLNFTKSKCGKYEYFTGKFKFVPKEIILP